MKRIILAHYKYQYFIHVENIISIKYHEYMQYKQWKMEMTDRSVIKINDKFKHANIQSIIDEVINSPCSICKQIKCDEFDESRSGTKELTVYVSDWVTQIMKE